MFVLIYTYYSIVTIVNYNKLISDLQIIVTLIFIFYTATELMTLYSISLKDSQW